MFKKLRLKYYKTSQNVNIIWMAWGNKFRWMSYECNAPVWWLPRFERFSKGVRFGWLVFAFGTGVVEEDVMNEINSHAV